MAIPLFHPEKACFIIQQDKDMVETITTVKQIYNNDPYLTELQFIPVSTVCGLPRYLNMAFFRRLEAIENVDQLVSFSAFVEGFMQIKRNRLDDSALFFSILKKSSSTWISPEDFLPVLEDVVLNHPGLKFLGDNPIFQERYIETVICRLFYDGKCASGKMNLSQFRKSNFAHMIKNLGPNVDLNNTRDCFSYKHFYVLYCKFWMLDQNHDLIISENDLGNYNDGLLSEKLTRQIMQHGRIPAFARENTSRLNNQERILTYLDYIWFVLSETDKSTPVAIEYWFRCMDDDGDGIITTFDLEEHWQDQEKKLFDIIDGYSEDAIRFDDLICQLNDLIRPQIPGKFRLSDLKRNGIIAERFFDTFLNIEKFQIHDTHQGLVRAFQQLEREKKKQYELERQRLLELRQAFLISEGCFDEQQDVLPLHLEQPEEPFSLGAWCDYAEQEYDLLLLNEQDRSEHNTDDSDWCRQQQQQQQHSAAVDSDDSDGEDEDEDEDEIELESPSHSNDELDESDSSHSSTSSTPTTPVMQHVHDLKQPSLHQQQNWDLASY